MNFVSSTRSYFTFLVRIEIVFSFLISPQCLHIIMLPKEEVNKYWLHAMCKWES